MPINCKGVKIIADRGSVHIGDFNDWGNSTHPCILITKSVFEI